jgi:hypothetical protein
VLVDRKEGADVWRLPGPLVGPGCLPAVLQWSRRRRFQIKAMNRRWRANAAQHLPSLPSYNEFTAKLPPLCGSDAGFAGPADIYSALCALHAKGEAPVVGANSSAGYYYLLANTGYNKAKVGVLPKILPVQRCQHQLR